VTSIATSGSSDLLGREMRRLHLHEYHRMIEAGVFDEDEGVELLEGVIVGMSPQNADHALVVERLSDSLFVGLPAELVIRCQLPLALSEADEPEPDVAVIDRSTPRSRRAQPTTARLIFEVAAESLRRDREIKAPLYAKAGIPEYVIVNLRGECLEVHREPDPASARYRTLATLDKSASFSSTSSPGVTFSIAQLLA
jgi:Uma2 family endonuclease